MESQFVILNDKNTKDIKHDVPKEKLHEYNKAGYGIFQYVNTMSGRKDTDVLEIRYWYLDLDVKLVSTELLGSYDYGSDKEFLLTGIQTHPIKPSVIIETANGFHIYFKAIKATPEKYSDIERGLQRAYAHLGADKNALNINRFLRVAGFYHNKKDPFKVKVVERSNIWYDEWTMLKLVPPVVKSAYINVSNTPILGVLEDHNIDYSGTNSKI